MSVTPRDSALLLAAVRFAAEKHRNQRRKDPEASPYINHPVEVAEVLARVGEVADLDVLRAAILHDTLEDTETTKEELVREFGATVAALVADVSDDKSLPKAERKRLQIEHAASLSTEAKLVKIADKICNVRDIADSPPSDWPRQRRLEYLGWSRDVVAGCRGTNPELETLFDQTLERAERTVATRGDPR
jgi:guanosine-3',5'-bis(diphosphate) 3'-pyrophosphohydrolase